jgi:hypothetical protein
MGTFHKEITIQRGIKGLVKNVRHRGSKKKSGGRTGDEMNAIFVHDMPIAPAMAGQLVVRSSNVDPQPVLGAGWSKGAKDRIEARLRNGGDKKGRVLYGVLECLGQPPTVACVLCYHISRAGQVVVQSVEVAKELATHADPLFEGMFLCAERIACEHSKGLRGDIEFEIGKDSVRWLKDTFGFRELRKSTEKSKRILGRVAEGCRAKQKRLERDRDRAEQVAR